MKYFISLNNDDPPPWIGPKGGGSMDHPTLPHTGAAVTTVITHTTLHKRAMYCMCGIYITNNCKTSVPYSLNVIMLYH